MPDLATFQRDFAADLISEGHASSSFRSEAFAVYRNTSARGVVEALRASYPTVDMLVGEEMFTEVALDYRRRQPPAGPILSDYGRTFPAYLSEQPWTSELPYLADVAALDWLWLESFLAAEILALPRSLDGTSRIRLHPATRFAWLDTPAMTIWLAHRDPWEAGEFEPEWQEEGALFTRAGNIVHAELISADYHELLRVCAAPATVADIVAAFAGPFPHADLPRLLQRGVTSGALIFR